MPHSERQLTRWKTCRYLARKFMDDRCTTLASALAFSSMLSIVPFLAIVFAVLKRLDVQAALAPILVSNLAVGSQELVASILRYINNTSVGQLGAIGLLSLVASALLLLTGVAQAFNNIWGVTETRSIARRFSSYFAVVTLGPVLVVAAISMTGSLESQTLVQRLLDMALVGNLLLLMFKVLPFVAMWLVLAGLYLFIPNARVTLRAALVGGVFGGTLWQLSQWVYVDCQVGVLRYNAIYGTLAALPIFMVWLYLAWAIVLLGVEVTFAVQNLGSVRRDLRGGRVSITGRTRVVLAVLLHLARRFHRGAAPPTAAVLANELEIPPRLLLGILELLQRLGLVTEVAGGDGASTYLPAREPETLELPDVLHRLAADGSDYSPPPRCPEAAVINRVVETLAAGGSGGLAGVTLRDLVRQVEAGAGGGTQSAGGV